MGFRHGRALIRRPYIIGDMLKLTVCLTLVLCLQSPMAAAENHVLGPDSGRHANIPQGQATKYQWTSKLSPGTVRDYWVYVPPKYTPEQPACPMVFQDGGTFVNETGAFRTTI